MTRRYRRVAATAATVLGLGRIPHAPGTACSLAAVITLSGTRTTPLLLWTVLVVVAVLGTWAAETCARAWKKRDPSAVVIDEFLGMGLALALSPGLGPQSAATAFILFRLFDILKPPPINHLERLPGGFGIMADDAGAGIAAAMVMWLLHFLSSSIPALEILIY